MERLWWEQHELLKSFVSGPHRMIWWSLEALLWNSINQSATFFARGRYQYWYFFAIVMHIRRTIPSSNGMNTDIKPTDSIRRGLYSQTNRRRWIGTIREKIVCYGLGQAQLSVYPLGSYSNIFGKFCDLQLAGRVFSRSRERFEKKASSGHSRDRVLKIWQCFAIAPTWYGLASTSDYFNRYTGMC